MPTAEFLVDSRACNQISVSISRMGAFVRSYTPRHRRLLGRSGLMADWSAVSNDSFRRGRFRSVAVRLLSIFLLACSFGLAQQAGPAVPRHVRIIATHDLHGALLPTTTFPWSNGRPIGGVNALKGVHQLHISRASR